MEAIWTVKLKTYGNDIRYNASQASHSGTDDHFITDNDYHEVEGDGNLYDALFAILNEVGLGGRRALREFEKAYDRSVGPRCTRRRE